jgi:hypothetical protein
MSQQKKVSIEVFRDNHKATLNHKYSRPVRVIKVINGMVTLQTNRDFGKDTRINISNLKRVRFWDKEIKKVFECTEGGGESIMA